MTESTSHIATLLDAHRKGDRDASAHLLSHYKQDLWGFLVNHMPERADAEDLFQEVSLKVLGHATDVREPERFECRLHDANTVKTRWR